MIHKVRITDANNNFNLIFFAWGVVRKGVCATVDIWRSEDDFQESFLSFNQVDSEYQAQVIHLGSKHLSTDPLAQMALFFNLKGKKKVRWM